MLNARLKLAEEDTAVMGLRLAGAEVLLSVVSELCTAAAATHSVNMMKPKIGKYLEDSEYLEGSAESDAP